LGAIFVRTRPEIKKCLKPSKQYFSLFSYNSGALCFFWPISILALVTDLAEYHGCSDRVWFLCKANSGENTEKAVKIKALSEWRPLAAGNFFGR
jgi:hypothetical protein